jgi:leader peptidase (prepilin peptidase)/N-methyltransferase
MIDLLSGFFGDPSSIPGGKWIIASFLFTVGSSLGSFYQNLAYRILVYFYSPQRKKYKGFRRWKMLLLNPSECESCGTKIRSTALVPIFGYWLTKGECRNCGYTIPAFYPFTEFLFGLLGILLYLATENPFISILFLCFLGHLLVSAYTDGYFFSLDYENLFWILGWGILLNRIAFGYFPGIQDFWVFLGFAGVFGLIHLFYPEGMGWGDVLFAPSFALIAGNPWWIGFLNVSMISAVFITVYLRKKENLPIRKAEIPLGIYLCLGLAVTVLGKIFLYYCFDLDFNQELFL